jgi:hypothetical protein
MGAYPGTLTTEWHQRAAAGREAAMDEQDSQIDFSLIETWQLVKELRKREGVETSTLSPDTEACVKVSGPAIVLVVID